MHTCALYTVHSLTASGTVAVGFLKVGTMGTLLNFGVGPVAGGLMDPDALGRKPFLVLVSEFQSFRVLRLHFFLRRGTLPTPVKQ